VIVYAGYKDMLFEVSEVFSIALQYPDFIIGIRIVSCILKLAEEYKASKHSEQQKQKILKDIEAIDPMVLSVLV